MSYRYNKIGYIFLISFSSLFICCTKFVKIPEPINTITNSETFGSDATATSAIAGIYNDLLTGHSNGGYLNLSFACGLITIDAGMSADELHSFSRTSPFETNTLNSSSFPAAYLWNGPYLDIYLANAVVENLSVSTGVSLAVRDQLTGEAKFLRAFCYFYLVNLYGDVPLATTTAYVQTDTLYRTPAALVYEQIITDLRTARQLLPDDYSISGDARVRANKGCVNALLARAWLYEQQWDSAEVAASSIINNKLYGLSNDLNSVFLINSQEAILQWQIPDVYPYATKEANTFIPNNAVSRPNYYLTDLLLSSFEPGDLRRELWVDSTQYSGKYYYFPSKYKVRQSTEGNVTENYVILRLAELYLIRAEARAQQNANLAEAIADLNVIRERAGLADLPLTLIQSQVLAAVAQERRIELFSEWGHRWLDLKRTGQANAVLAPIKPTWQPNAKLYPLPAVELVNDGNLVQNPDY